MTTNEKRYIVTHQPTSKQSLNTIERFIIKLYSYFFILFFVFCISFLLVIPFPFHNRSYNILYYKKNYYKN